MIGTTDYTDGDRTFRSFHPCNLCNPRNLWTLFPGHQEVAFNPLIVKGSLGRASAPWQSPAMSTLTIALPDSLDAVLSERAKASGARSKEEYLVSLVESDCAAGELDAVLAKRSEGPFAPLEADWKERVRTHAAKQSNA